MNNTVENAAKAKACAAEKAPGEKWIEIYPGIYFKIYGLIPRRSAAVKAVEKRRKNYNIK
jgi:hypothetical protein